MANTTLSSIGGVIQGSDSDEIIVGAMGDAAAIAGNLVTIANTGVVDDCDIDGGIDGRVGILLPSIKVDMDAAPGATIPVQVVIPRSGHLYGVHCDTDQGVVIGYPLIHHATTAGIIDELAALETYQLCRKFRGASGDTFIIVIWGAA